jgi:NAD(P)-dependent dehydrogenase (short-subunit alcohol dehydrogenase family)
MYAITKATIDAMVTLASRENTARGVRVNCLSPGGMVDTQLFGPAKMPEWLKEQHPPLPLDVMNAAATWLASDDSASVSGAFVSAKEFNARPVEETLAALTPSN